MATLSHAESRRLYSWWWDSHISPKNSKWLQENLTDMDIKVKAMIKLIEEDADSFRKRAEMYYRKRPELMKLVEEFYRAYRALAERYDHATGALRQAHRTMAEAFPDQIPLILMDDPPPASSTDAESLSMGTLPHDRALDFNGSQKGAVDMSSRSTAFQRNGAFLEENDASASKGGSWKSTTGEEFANGWGRNGSKDQSVEEKGSGDKVQQEVQQLSEECQILKNQVIRETERANKAEAEAANLKDSVSKLESEKEAVSIQYRLSLEKISSLDADISRMKEDFKKLNDEMLAGKSESRSLESRYHLLEKENQFLRSELGLFEETTQKQQEELDAKIEELKKLNISLMEECERSTQAEMRCLSLEKLHSQSQEEVRKLSLENQNWVEKLRNVEMTKAGLEEAIQKLKEEIGTLNEQSFSSAFKIKGLQDEISSMEKSKRKLEDEAVRHAEEKRSLQQEVLSIKADKRVLELRHHELTEQIGAVNLNVETLQAMVKELRDGNVELKELCKKHQDERILHLESLRFMEKITEKNATLENSLLTANAELEELREQVKALEEACETLHGKISMHMSEKAVLVSQIEVIARNMEKLSEKNTLLENSLSDVNVELEGLREKLNALEDSCQDLRDQNYTLLAERSSLVTKVESISHSLDNLESRYANLEGKNSNLETEKAEILRQVWDLQNSLRIQKEDYEILNESTRNQLDDLESQVRMLQEKGRHTEEELELEHHRIIDAQLEIFILQRILHDMKETNMLLSDKCQKYLETSMCQEKLVSELKQEIFMQKESLTWLLQYNEKLVDGIHRVMRVLKVSECQSLDDVHFKLILLEIENLKTSILDAQDDNQHLALEKLVILTLLEQYGVDLAELKSEKSVIEQELKMRLEEIVDLQSGKHQLQDLSEQLRQNVQASNRREQILKTEVEILCKNLSDVQESRSTLQGDIAKLIEEKQSFSKKISDLSEENGIIEGRNSAFVAEIMNLENLYLIFRSYNAEKTLELQLLSDNMENLRGVNSGLEQEIRSLKEKLGSVEIENMDLKESLNDLEGCRRRLVILEDEVKTASSICRELNLQLETGKNLQIEQEMELLQINHKFEAVRDKNAELSGKIEGLMRDVDEGKAAREELEEKNIFLLECNTQKDKEIATLHHINDTLSQRLDKVSKEVEELRKRVNVLTSELEERIEEVNSCESEIEALLNDLHVTTVKAATFEEKMLELLIRCESLEMSSMAQKEMFYEEISRRNVYEDELKGKLDEMDGENSGLKEELSACLPLILSFGEFIASLEQRILPLANRQSLNDPEEQRKNNEEGNEDHHALSSPGIRELQKLQVKVNSLEKVVIDILDRLEHERHVSKVPLQDAEIGSRDLKPGVTNVDDATIGEDIILHLKKKEETASLMKRNAEMFGEKPEQMMKDIQLDHVLTSSQYEKGASSHTSSATSGDETKDHMMELWETIACNKMEKPSPVTSERDLECHQIEAVEEEKSVCSASRLAAVKELSIDKIDLIKHQEWSGSINERLSSDAQRLSVLQEAALVLRRNMEVSELNVAPSSFEFKQVKAQLKEAEAAISQLIDTNNKLTRKAEKLSSSSGRHRDEIGNTSGRKILERAQRGSEKIGKLELELQKLEYIWLKLKEEHDYKKARAADRRTRVLLRDYLYGRRESPRRKKVHCCACMRPRTKDE